jgi:alpha-glucosidase (family GH31 glycosyl hydrolase)
MARREITRAVDLETMPLYVRAGSVLPFAPARQYTGEKTGGPTEVVAYPGANGRFILYEDDGVSFDYRKGVYSRFHFDWNDETSELGIRGPQTSRQFRVRRATSSDSRLVEFRGTPLRVRL